MSYSDCEFRGYSIDRSKKYRRIAGQLLDWSRNRRCEVVLHIDANGVYRDLAVSVLDFALRNCGSADEYSTDDVRLTSWNILSGHASHRDEGFGFVASAETLALFDAINAKRRPTTHRPVENSRPSPRAISYFPPFSFAHRASTAFLAISVRCAGESFAARALPPRDCKARS